MSGLASPVAGVALREGHALRWLLAAIGDAGIKHIVARSRADDGSTWSSMWPWEHQLWDMPTAFTIGLSDGDATWVPADGRVAAARWATACLGESQAVGAGSISCAFGVAEPVSAAMVHAERVTVRAGRRAALDGAPAVGSPRRGRAGESRALRGGSAGRTG